MFNLWTDPTLVPGIGKYEKYDAGWLEALIAYQLNNPVSFPRGGKVIPIPDQVSIALAGDWGTGIDPANGNIGNLITEEKPDLTIHLGDVYYSGSESEEDKFATEWPAGKLGSLTLNSNHEMYSGGKGYLKTLANPKFSIQGGRNYFALRNSNWLIFGLDTARYTNSFLYKDGALDNEQLDWIKAIINSLPNHKVIFLSHHDGFNLATLEGPEYKTSTSLLYKPLWEQLKPFPRHLWYWGHVHCPAVYTGVRCIGHGGVPYLPFHSNPRPYGDDKISLEWVETETLANSNRAPNGYAMLWLNDIAVQEQLVDELGRVRWQASYIAK